jgi:hypothetical protein
MSLWMEIRCDVNRSTTCWDIHNRMVSDGGFNRAQVVRRARSKGWSVERNGDATCPACRVIQPLSQGSSNVIR